MICTSSNTFYLHCLSHFKTFIIFSPPFWHFISILWIEEKCFSIEINKQFISKSLIRENKMFMGVICFEYFSIVIWWIVRIFEHFKNIFFRDRSWNKWLFDIFSFHWNQWHRLNFINIAWYKRIKGLFRASNELFFRQISFLRIYPIFPFKTLINNSLPLFYYLFRFDIKMNMLNN